MTIQRLVTLLCLAWTCSAQASLIFVNTLDDELNSDGDCSFREAVEAANTNAAVDDCTTGQSVQTDSIFIPLAGEITLGSHITITDRVTITGGGREATIIKGSGSHPLLRVDMANTSHDFELSQLTLRDGFAVAGLMGGAIQFMEGDTFELRNVAFINNEVAVASALDWAGGGAVGAGPLLDSADPTLLVQDCLFQDNRATGEFDNVHLGRGGAIWTSVYSGGGGTFLTRPLTSLSIVRSEFRDNTSKHRGSAIFASYVGAVSITDSVFAGQDWIQSPISGSRGTAVALIGEGGTTVFVSNTSFDNNQGIGGSALDIGGYTVSVTNSTFYQNNSPAMRFSGEATALVAYSTFYDNGRAASLASDASLFMRGSIAWDINAGITQCDIEVSGGSYTSLGHNIDSGSSCATLGTDLPNTDPQLAAYGDYGDSAAGIELHTMLPIPGGPAVDGGELDTCTGPLGGSITTDQRGETRPVDGAESGANLCDIGAVEYQFEQDPAFGSLTVSVQGTGFGVVESNIPGIYCSPQCSANYVEQTLVRLTPTASPGSVFAGWDGACTGTGLCQVTIANNKSVTATFNTAPVSEVIFKDGFEDP